MNTAQSNQELVNLLKNGDMAAFDALYNRYCDRLFRFVIRYIKVKADAEEIVQEVFLKIWENRSKLNVFCSFESFLFTIAYNSTISLLRKRVCENKYLSHLKSIQQVIYSEGITDEIHFKELTRELNIIINDLTPRQKEIYLLSRNEGLSHEMIAKKLGISINTVKNHMVNTLSFLKSKIDKQQIVNLLFISFFI